jgi:Uma2 family endonuclease
MSPRTRPDLVTAEELYALPEDGVRHELLRGTLVAEPVPSSLRGKTVARLTELLGSFVRPRRLGVVYAGDAGFILARKPDTVRGPDVAFVSAERERQASEAHPYFPGAPDLAIEVLSPGDRPNEVLAKVSDYLAAGCRLVWVVDPVREEVRAFRSTFTPRVLAGDDVLEGEDVVPDFSARLTDIFQD